MADSVYVCRQLPLEATRIMHIMQIKRMTLTLCAYTHAMSSLVAQCNILSAHPTMCNVIRTCIMQFFFLWHISFTVLFLVEPAYGEAKRKWREDSRSDGHPNSHISDKMSSFVLSKMSLFHLCTLSNECIYWVLE